MSRSSLNFVNNIRKELINREFKKESIQENINQVNEY
jgi:hypothetical protein